MKIKELRKERISQSLARWWLYSPWLSSVNAPCNLIDVDVDGRWSGAKVIWDGDGYMMLSCYIGWWSYGGGDVV